MPTMTKTLIAVLLSVLLGAASGAQTPRCIGCTREVHLPTMPGGYSFTYTIAWGRDGRDGRCMWYTNAGICFSLHVCQGTYTLKVTNTGFPWYAWNQGDTIYRAGDVLTVTGLSYCCNDMGHKHVTVDNSTWPFRFSAGCTGCVKR